MDSLSSSADECDGQIQALDALLRYSPEEEMHLFSETEDDNEASAIEIFVEDEYTSETEMYSKVHEEKHIQLPSRSCDNDAPSM
jgi:hypothetical protein